MGSMPFGFLLTKLFLKIDIREIGSGNIGATNVLRTGNKLIGYGTLILDIVKAVFVAPPKCNLVTGLSVPIPTLPPYSRVKALV